jgi:molybdopterin converting factor small subunit
MGTKEARLRVLLYGRLADVIGRQVEVDAPGGSSVGELRRELASRHPAAAEALDRSRACVERSFVSDEHVLTAGEEVEFLPPVSGG